MVTKARVTFEIVLTKRNSKFIPDFVREAEFEVYLRFQSLKSSSTYLNHDLISLWSWGLRMFYCIREIN